ncbi:discoidin domain-containing protein [Methylibium rhizosphaerae]|uniref:discoidin domain-containing protein n=1 Tax=Methylibium rhizosphaerae TaxID=2570323 RepID=UPI00112B0305|nr:discoidin domain-containing protein [Methylibium rhizosphaerae]
MPAYRYWRLEITGRQAYSTGIGELSLRTAVGAGSVATGGTPISSADYQGFVNANAFDGNPSTFWLPSNAGSAVGWIGYDFGAGNEQDIVEWAADCSAASVGGQVPEKMVLAYSADGVNWTGAYPILRPPAEQGVYGAMVSYTNDLAPAKVRGQAGRVIPGWPTGGLVARSWTGTIARPDAQDGGRYHLHGTVKVDGTPDIPVSRRVWLFDHDGARLVREQWSDAVTGAYDFRHIALKPYFVVAFDHTHNFRAVIADRVMPEPMTT